MTLDEKISAIKKKRKEISNLKKEIITISSSVFDEFCKNIFTKYSQLESFGWTQYTPYFNDGDVCVFHANTDYLKINGKFAEESDWYSDKKVVNYGKWNQKLKKYEDREETDNLQYNPDLYNACQEITNFLVLFDENFYLEKYGDHAEITITPLGISVDECDHD